MASVLLGYVVVVRGGFSRKNGGSDVDQQLTAFEHYEHGLVLKRVKMFGAAIQDFQKAAGDDQYAGKAHLQIALCLRAIERHEDAIQEFRQALAVGRFSSDEQRHIFYHIGQTLESLGRHADSIEIYGRICNEAPGFRDVAKRIKYLNAGGRGPLPESQDWWQASLEALLARGRELTPHFVSALEQTGQWFSRHAGTAKPRHRSDRAPAGSRGLSGQRASHGLSSKRQGQQASRDRSMENRRHPRVPVRLNSHFSSKGQALVGEGELRDLSPWGCRVTSPVSIPVGTNVECFIFAQDAVYPFVIEGATVRWINAREFGLSFTNVRPAVRQQIAQLCRKQAA